MAVSRVEQSYDRMSELKAFDDTKTGVKGLVDSGITKVPQIFILPPNKRAESSEKCETHFTFPVIDLQGIDEDPIKHKEIVDKVRDASETWGFFQVVNHGIPTSVLDKTLQGTRQFFEQDTEVKKQYYTRDTGKKVIYTSNLDLYRPSVPAASWRDSIFCFVAPNPPSPQEFPTPCGEILMDYSKDVTKLGFSLLELLSEGLGFDRSYLKDYMDCCHVSYSCNYYPPCPQPELTMGTIQHTDVDFVTVLLQDDIGGLQVLHQNHWIDVPPTPGALVVNIGDLLVKSLSIENICWISNKFNFNKAIIIISSFSITHSFSLIQVPEFSTSISPIPVSSSSSLSTSPLISSFSRSSLAIFSSSNLSSSSLTFLLILFLIEVFNSSQSNVPKLS